MANPCSSDGEVTSLNLASNRVEDKDDDEWLRSDRADPNVALKWQVSNHRVDELGVLKFTQKV